MIYFGFINFYMTKYANDTRKEHFLMHNILIAGNRQLYLEDIASGKQPGKGERLTPLHITKDDRQKYTSIQNKNMTEIRALIEREIEQIRSLGCEEEATKLRTEWDRKIKTQKKQALIMFYTREVLLALDEAVNNHPLLGEYTYTNKYHYLLQNTPFPRVKTLSPCFWILNKLYLYGSCMWLLNCGCLALDIFGRVSYSLRCFL